MPEILNVNYFVDDILNDIHSPLTSQFSANVLVARKAIDHFEEKFESERIGLNKIRKSIKAIHNSGMNHVSNEIDFTVLLDLLSTNAMNNDEERELSPSLNKFSVLFQDLTTLLKNLMQNLKNTVMYPLETFLKSEAKGEIRKPFDRALKEFENKIEKIKKEKFQAAREAGLPKPEIDICEISDEVERERRLLQLHLCEYLIHVNDFKVRKGADFIQNLIDYYSAQILFVQESLKTLEHFGCFMHNLKDKVSEIRGHHDLERRKLTDLRAELKTLVVNKEVSSVSTAGVYSLHQQQGNTAYGNYKSGFLYKKSDGKVKRVWQKRRACCNDGMLALYHADDCKPPVHLSLLTCQVKPSAEDLRSFYLVSNNRTYHLASDSDAETEEWIAILNNAKAAVFDAAMHDMSASIISDAESSLAANSSGLSCLPLPSQTTTLPTVVSNMDSALLKTRQLSDSSPPPFLKNVKLAKRRSAILNAVQKLDGNDRCADCSALHPQWLSVNLGLLICLECCGLHRQMGVQQSRTQSLTMDELPTCQLLQARFVGNARFNRVFEATLPDGIKVGEENRDLAMERRQDFIRQKYTERRYVCQTASEDKATDLRHDLIVAVKRLDQDGLLQAFGEGVALMQVLPPIDDDGGVLVETALHQLLRFHDEQTPGALQMADFIMQNSSSVELRRVTEPCLQTIMHYCCRYNRPQTLKLVLRYCAQLTNVRNSDGQTPEEVALPMANNAAAVLCVRLLQWHRSKAAAGAAVATHLDDGYCSEEMMLRGPHARFDHISIDWLLEDEEKMSADDDEEQERCSGWQLQNSCDSGQGVADIATIKPSRPPPLQRYLSSELSFDYTAGHRDNLATVVATLPRKCKARAPPPPAASQSGHDAFFSSPLASIHFENFFESTPMKPTPSNQLSVLNEAHSNDHIDVIIDLLAEEPSTSSRKFGSVASSTATHTLPLPHRRRSSTSSTLPKLEKEENKKLTPPKLCQAMFDCEADSFDELTFAKGEFIRVVREESADWWRGEIDGQPTRRGLFPASYVQLC